jgi:TonB family protein
VANPSERIKNIYLAVIISLSLHILLLLILFSINPNKVEEEFIPDLEMDYVELTEPLFLPEELGTGIQTRNLVANTNSERSYDQTNYSKRSQDQMAEDVYDALKQLEAETFAKLQEGKEDFDEESGYDEKIKDDAASDEAKDDYAWFGEERSYGAATVEFDLKGRDGRKLPPPSYRCKGQGRVVVGIEVGQDGLVSKVELIESAVNSECLEQEALNYALKSRFNQTLSAPKKQNGTITYRFVAQ